MPRKRFDIVISVVTKGAYESARAVTRLTGSLGFLGTTIGRSLYVTRSLVNVFTRFGLVAGSATLAVYGLIKSMEILWTITKALVTTTLALIDKLKELILEYIEISRKASSAAAVMQDFKENILNAAASVSTMGISFEDSITGMEEFARAGYNAIDTYKSFTPTVMFARAANINLSRATTLLTGALKGFNMSAEDAYRVVNTMTGAILKTRFDFETLETAFAFGGVAGAAFDQTLEHTLATLMAFRNLGLQASTAGTVFRRALQRLIKPTREAKKAIKRIGLTIDDLKVSATNSFGDIIKKLAQTKTNALELRDAVVQIIGTRFGAYVTQLVNITRQELKGVGKDVIGELEKSLKLDPALAFKVFKYRLTDISGQLDIVRTQWERLKIFIVMRFEPAIRMVLAAVAELLIQINEYFGLGDNAEEFEKKMLSMSDKIKQKFDFEKEIEKFKESIKSINPVIDSVLEHINIAFGYLRLLIETVSKTISDIELVATSTEAGFGPQQWLVAGAKKIGSWVGLIKESKTKTEEWTKSLTDFLTRQQFNINKILENTKKGIEKGTTALSDAEKVMKDKIKKLAEEYEKAVNKAKAKKEAEKAGFFPGELETVTIEPTIEPRIKALSMMGSVLDKEKPSGLDLDFNLGTPTITPTVEEYMAATREDLGLSQAGKLLFGADDKDFKKENELVSAEIEEAKKIQEKQQEYNRRFYVVANKRMREFAKDARQSFVRDLCRSLTKGADNMKEIFRNFVKDMIAKAMELYVIKKIIADVFGGGLFGKFFNRGSTLAGVGGNAVKPAKAAFGSPLAGFGGGYTGMDSVPALLKPDEIVLDSNASNLFRQLVAGGSVSRGNNVNINMTVVAMDAESFENTMHDKIIPSLTDALKHNATLRTALQESIEGKV